MGGRTGRFRRSDRLLDARDFRRVLRKGRRRASPELVVVTAPKRDFTIESKDLDSAAASAAGPGCRLGITASRKVGGAVVRNHFKRQLREWFRHHRSELPPGTDLVVIARRAGVELTPRELEDRLADLLALSSGGRRSARGGEPR